MAIAAFVVSIMALVLLVPVVFMLGVLLSRVQHLADDTSSGWAAVAESIDEIKAHLGALYKKTEVLPDGGVVKDER